MREDVIKIARIIKDSELSKAKFANVGVPEDEFEYEVIKVSEKIVKILCPKKFNILRRE